jgi:hypothetical protein
MQGTLEAPQRYTDVQILQQIVDRLNSTSNGSRPIGVYKEVTEEGGLPVQRGWQPEVGGGEMAPETETPTTQFPIAQAAGSAALELDLTREVPRHRRPPEWRQRVRRGLGRIVGVASITAGFILLSDGLWQATAQ